MSEDDPTRIALVSTFLPRRCGLATFTDDLRTALCGVAPRWQIDICAVDRDGLAYGTEVTTVIRQDVPADYRRAARALADAGTDLVMIQHEYGIFGGHDGGYVLHLAAGLREYGVPYTVTLHTVPSRPTTGQAATLAELCRHAARVTVFTDTAGRLAVETGLVGRAALATVPHGAPDILRSFVDPDSVGPAARTALDRTADTRVLATFGLLGPGKGVEHAIAALPAVIARHPDVVYLVAGATHPEVARHTGEAYRQRLARLAADHGVSEHVHFLDAFLSASELAVLLARTHVFLTPYRSPDQICSGALTFALTAGCPVVSTDYRYARDLLAADGTGDPPGVLVPCGDVGALAGAVGDLLDDPDRWRRAGLAADSLGSRLTWPSVATRFADVIDSILRPRRPAPAEVVTVPRVRLDHLRRLTDEIGPGDHAAVVLVEHLWASQLREAVLEAGGRLLGQGFLTPEVVMVVGAELEARANAEAAIELADAARGAALVEALDTLAARSEISAEDRTRAAAQVVRALVAKGFLHEPEAAAAIDALATEGLMEAALVQAAVAEAEDLLDRRDDQ